MRDTLYQTYDCLEIDVSTSVKKKKLKNIYIYSFLKDRLLPKEVQCDKVARILDVGVGIDLDSQVTR